MGPSDEEDQLMPPPSPELLLVGALIIATLEVLPPDLGPAYRAKISEVLDSSLAGPKVVPLRRQRAHPAMAWASCAARAWWRRMGDRLPGEARRRALLATQYADRVFRPDI